MLLLWAPAASAATLSFSGATLVYMAAAGETNSLSVRLDGTAIVFADAGAVITDVSVPICTQPDQHTVVCQGAVDMPLQLSVRAELGDGNDQGALDLPLIASIHGGEGEDALTVSTSTPPVGPVEAFGDDGNDALNGGAGGVILHGGSGDDQLGASASGGLLRGDEGADQLTGSGGRDLLIGGADGDVIVAGEGDDMIEGDGSILGDAADRVDAGPGNDSVQSGGGDDDVTGGRWSRQPERRRRR